jgi:hypothetical protein
MLQFYAEGEDVLVVVVVELLLLEPDSASWN